MMEGSFMKRLLSTILLTAVMIMLVGSSAALAWLEATPDDISKALKKDMVHPYLFFTEDEKQDILDRIENDPHSAEIMARFLAEGNRAKVTIQFRGREIANPSMANRVVKAVLEGMEGIGIVDQPPKMEGRRMTFVLRPATTGKS